MPVSVIACNEDQSLTLAEALGVVPGDVVAFVGAGGKTTAMFHLAADLAARGSRVLVTTTTHIFPPDPARFPKLVLAETALELLSKARLAFDDHKIVVAARHLNPDGRLAGIEPAWINEFDLGSGKAGRHGQPSGEQPDISFILVEADGSKGRPFKAPAEYEPVIPACASLVVPVVGLSVLNRPLVEEFVHRPERVARLAAVRSGETVTPALVAAVMEHPEGSTRGRPGGARVVPLLNQADDAARLAGGLDLARELLLLGARRVVLGAVETPNPVRGVVTANTGDAISEGSNVSAIVLAAGLGRRMGRLKLGLPLGGKSLLRHVVEAALASSVSEVVVVLGHGAADLALELPPDARLRAVYNPDFTEGQSSSVRCGVTALDPSAEAAIFLLADQPLIAPETINAVAGAFRTSRASIVQPLYRGVAGHPVLFSRALFGELLQVSGDQGGRAVLARHRAECFSVELPLEFPQDIDTIEDYEKVAAALPHNGSSAAKNGFR